MKINPLTPATFGVALTLIALVTFCLGYWLGQKSNQTTQVNQALSSNTKAPIKTTNPLPTHNTAAPNKITSINQQSSQAATPTATSPNLDAIRQLIAQGKPNQALAQLKSFIQQDYNSATAWQLKAETAQQLQLAHEAVDAWFQYLRLELDSEKILRGLQNLQKYLLALSGQVNGASAENDWLIEQWNHLLETAPAAYTSSSNSGQAHLALARLYQLAQDDYQTQYHALAAANDPSIKSETQAFLAQLNGASLQTGIKLPLQRYGQQFLLEVQLNGQRARLLLDTGASISGLGRNFLSRHSELVKNTRPIELHTASGTEQTYVFSLDEIQLGDASFHQQLMVALPMATADFDGLLGIDLLGKFHFVIDQNKAELQLKPRD